MSKTNVICIVPIKNEAWVLDDFIQCVQRWADLIIVGDNGSIDNGIEIARAHDNVEVISIGASYDEHNARNLLINEARKIAGKSLIFCLDADEMISANWTLSAEWQLMLQAEPGTAFQFDWVELLPGLQEASITSYQPIVAFVDDGSVYFGRKLHSPRLPVSMDKVVKLNEIKLLHYVFIEPERLFSKHRWYKRLEYIHNNNRPWRICITYQDTKIKCYGAPIIPVREEWLQGYEWLDKYRSPADQNSECYWYDAEVMDYFDTYGVDKFRKLNIWDVDWSRRARMLGRSGDYSDPRSIFEKWIHKFIERYRESLNMQKDLKWKIIYRLGSVMLKPFGW